MKKLLTLTTIFASLLIGSSATITSNIVGNQSNIYQMNKSFATEDWIWDGVDLFHEVVTPVTGTHVREDTEKGFKATAQSWDNFFLKSKQVVANGYFALHTYNGPKFSDSEVLNLDENNSSDTLRLWSWSGESDTWNGWGHHTSRISLTLTAEYDEKEKITSLFLNSYIYARTAGAVHVCSTTSKINDLRVII